MPETVWKWYAAAADAPLTQFAMADALEPSQHGGHGAESKELIAALSQASVHFSRGLSVDFAKLEQGGCRTLNFDGRPVLEVCFPRNGKWYHCYIVRCRDFPALRANESPKYAAGEKMNAVTWADGVHRFVVAGQSDRTALAQLL